MIRELEEELVRWFHAGLFAGRDYSTCLQAKGSAGLNDEQGHNLTRNRVFIYA